MKSPGWEAHLSPDWNISAITVAMSTDPASAPESRMPKRQVDISNTNFNEEGHHIKKLFHIDVSIAVFVEQVEHLEKLMKS